MSENLKNYEEGIAFGQDISASFAERYCRDLAKEKRSNGKDFENPSWRDMNQLLEGLKRLAKEAKRRYKKNWKGEEKNNNQTRTTSKRNPTPRRKT